MTLPIPTTDFTQYSYDELVAAATAYVANAPGFGQSYSSSFGQTLIQLMAKMTEELNYMLERRTQENYMQTARLQTSIWALANSIGYRPTRKVSANGQVSIQLQDSSGNPVVPVGTVTVPAYSQLNYGGTTNFVNTADIVVNPSQVGPTTSNFIKEGTIASITVDPSDVTTTLNQNGFILLTNYVSIENTSILISDTNGAWFDVTTSIGGASPIGAISFAAPTDRVYDVKVNTQGLMIVFGDGTTGLQPTIPLTVKWIVSSGAAVNIVNTGLSFSLPGATLPEVPVLTPPNNYAYLITNTTPITGGIDEESLSSIQANSSDFVRSADRAVTNGDYAFWAKKSGIGGIVDAITYGQAEAGVNPYQMNNVYVTYLSNSESEPTLSMTNADLLRAYLTNLKTMTSYIVLQPATIIPVEVAFRIKKNPNLSMANAQLYQLLMTGIQGFFPLEQGSLGESILKAVMIKFFMNYQVPDNNQNVNAASWVTVDLYCLNAVKSPLTTNDIQVTITSGTNGDNYTLKINGTAYTYTQSGSPTAATIASTLAAMLPSGTVTATTLSNVITIVNTVPNTTFTISNTGSTTPAHCEITQAIALPPYLLPNQNTSAINLFLPGSIQVVNSDTGTVLFTDDGAGNIAGGTVNYVTGAMAIPILTEGNYYIRYQEDFDENLMANQLSAFEYSLPAPFYGQTNGTVLDIAVTAGGSGYTSAPTVVLSGGGFSSTAVAVATIAAGQVVSVSVTNPGVGYTSVPTVSFTGGAGTGATATAQIYAFSSITIL